MLAFQRSFLSTCEGRSVNSLREDFKTALQSGIQQYVPQRSISFKSSLPWITQDIKRTMRKRESLYDKYKKHRRPADRHAHLEYKQLANRKLKEAHNRYIEEILGITNSAEPNDSNSEPQTATDPQVNSLATTKLYSLLKHSRMDSKRSAPLKQNGQPHTNTTDKANILNQQFQSVFTPKTPLKLNHSHLWQFRTMWTMACFIHPIYPVRPLVLFPRCQYNSQWNIEEEEKLSKSPQGCRT